MFSFFLQGNKRAVLIRAICTVAVISVVDWRVEGNISLGFLYLFPMVLMGSVRSRAQIALAAAVCMILAEWFDPFPWTPEAGGPRDIMMFSAFLGMGLVVYEAAKNRQRALDHLHEIEAESQARLDAEEQIKVLIESSPAAIFMLDAGGNVLVANEAAHRLLGFQPNELRGASVHPYLPALTKVPPLDEAAPLFRTVMQCRGRRLNGEVFLADVWFSTYRTSSGPRLAAMIVDSSDDLRDREEFSLRQLLTASRVLVGAVSHEIRNMCGAIAVVHANLGKKQDLAGSEDFQALGTLVEGLGTIASLELLQNTAGTSEDTGGIELHALMEELRIVIEPPLRHSGVAVRWEIAPGMPAVLADRQRLMQVFLNLAKNSERALQGSKSPELQIAARFDGRRVVVRFHDNGPGVTNPDQLFQPFQKGAESTGLGLYLSRAFLRSFKGELRHAPQSSGCCFVLELTPAMEAGDDTSEPAGNAHSAAVQSHGVP
jgi:two-component system, LuxR family, sensor kinase FixL